jgi:hypothetical protein
MAWLEAMRRWLTGTPSEADAAKAERLMREDMLVEDERRRELREACPSAIT